MKVEKVATGVRLTIDSAGTMTLSEILSPEEAAQLAGEILDAAGAGYSLMAEAAKLRRELSDLATRIVNQRGRLRSLQWQADRRRAERDALARRLDEAERERDEARVLASKLRLEARVHAQEARTQAAIVRECYQAATGGTGEPGDWNGAEPVRACIAALRAERDAARGRALAYIADLAATEEQRDALAARVGELDGFVWSVVQKHDEIDWARAESTKHMQSYLYGGLLSRARALLATPPAEPEDRPTEEPRTQSTCLRCGDPLSQHQGSLCVLLGELTTPPEPPVLEPMHCEECGENGVSEAHVCDDPPICDGCSEPAKDVTEASLCPRCLSRIEDPIPSEEEVAVLARARGLVYSIMDDPHRVPGARQRSAADLLPQLDAVIRRLTGREEGK